MRGHAARIAAVTAVAADITCWASDIHVPALEDRPSGKQRRRRVAPGDCSPGAPTDPDVRISRIRLLETRFRYVLLWTMRGGGSGSRSSSLRIHFHVFGAARERRDSHLCQTRPTSNRKRASATMLKVTP